MCKLLQCFLTYTEQTGGLLQQISDYLRMRREKDAQDPEVSQQLNQLWMTLLSELLRLCQDERAEIRDAAVKFLFHGLFTHSSFLMPEDWKRCLWDVILPLLKSIRLLNGGPSTKQIDDSQVLVFNAVGQLCRDFLARITLVEEYREFISATIGQFQEAFLTSRSDVATTAINNLNHIATASAALNPQEEEKKAPLDFTIEEVWKAWIAIGAELQKRANQTPSGQATEANPLTQQNLQAFIEALAPLLALKSIRSSLEAHKQILGILKTALTWTASPEYRPDVDTVTPLQAAVLGMVQNLDVTVPGVSALVLTDLAQYCTLAFVAPFEPPPAQPTDSRIPLNRRITYIALSKASMPQAMSAYLKQQLSKELYEQGAVEQLLKVCLCLSYVDTFDN
jgi:hypothetical protein